MSDWKQYFWKNTLSNYVRMITRLLLGLVLFRLLFSGLNDAEFGFWSLLWSLFGYGVLLDFGFGFTAQKAVAEKTTTGDIKGLSHLLSTMLWTFVGLGFVIAVFFFSIKNPFLSSVSIPPEYYAEFSKAYLIFFFGMAVIFPFGLFPEMLRGLQKLYLANWINTASVVLNFFGILIALHLKLKFSVIILISVVTTVAPNVIASIIAMRLLKGVSLSPRLFQLSAVKQQMGFSIVAYLITFSNLIMGKSDQLVISLVVGVSAISIYQAGFKVGEMLNMFTIQLQDALSPAAASMHAKGDNSGLVDLLMKSSRLTFIVTTPLYGLCVVYLDPLIRLLTGLEVVPETTYWIGQFLLLAIYSSQLTNSCSKRILMMCGHEKKLLFISLTDALLNVIVSIILAFQIGVLGVALGTLIPTIVVGWVIMIPTTLRFLNINPLKYFAFHFDGTVKPLIVFLLCITITVLLFPIPNDSNFFDLAWRGALAGLPGLLLSIKVARTINR